MVRRLFRDVGRVVYDRSYYSVCYRLNIRRGVRNTYIAALMIISRDKHNREYEESRRRLMTGTGGSKMETIIYILTAIFILIIGVTLLLSFSVVALFAVKTISSIIKKFDKED